MLSPLLGFISVALLTVSYLIFGSGSLRFRFLNLLLVTLPLYMVPVVPGLPVIASWSSLFLVIFCIGQIGRRVPFAPFDFYFWLVFALASIVTALNSRSVTAEIYYVAQVGIFFIPVSLALLIRKAGRINFGSEEQQRLLTTIGAVIVATSIGVLVQWLLATRFGIPLGHIAHFRARTTFDLLVPAYSALSALLSIGLPLGPIFWRLRMRVRAVLIPVVSSVAILINSSRTGLVAGVVGLALILVFPPRGSSRLASTILLLPAAIFAVALINLGKGLSRYESGGFWSGNGRLETYSEGLDLWLQSPSYIIFGYGYAAYPTLPPHNFIIETLVCSGLLVAMTVFLWYGRAMIAIWNSHWCYLVITYLIAGLFFSGFYNFKPLTIIVIVALLAAPEEQNVNLRNSRARELQGISKGSAALHRTTSRRGLTPWRRPRTP